MIPYFIVLIWMIGMSWFVVRNTTVINTNTVNRAKAICIANNQLKSIVNTIITTHSTSSTEPDKQVWLSLHLKLASQLAPGDCDDSNTAPNPVEKGDST